MGRLAYLPHLLYSTALTSVGMHHLHQRKAAEADRAHVAAQLSVLADLAARLRPDPESGLEPVPARECERLWRLAKSHDVFLMREREAAAQEAAERAGGEGGEGGAAIGWREVLLGKRFDTARSEALDRADLERVREEVESEGRAGAK